jgi:hypothetical protein
MMENILSAYYDFLLQIQILWPKIVWAVVIIALWSIISFLSYFVIIFLFKKFKLNELLQKLKEKPKEEAKKKDPNAKLKWDKDLIDEVRIDDLVAKWVAVYLLILFLKLAISYIWITEVEAFLTDLSNYLPSLFVWILIWFFGIRFSNSIYNIIYTTLTLSKKITDEKTAKIIAYGWKITILFFTLVVFLDYTKIVSNFIINTIIVGFVFAISLASWLAFWLGWKDSARDIIENLKNNDNNLKD